MGAPTTSLDMAVANLELLRATIEAMSQRNMRYNLISKPSAQVTTPQKSTDGTTNVRDMFAEARYP
jgi:hypothetical protein